MFFDDVISKVSTCVVNVVYTLLPGPLASCVCLNASTATTHCGDELAEALFDKLKAHYSVTGEDFNAEAIATAICILSQQSNKDPLVAVLRLLLERHTQDKEIAVMTEAIGDLVHALKSILLAEPAGKLGSTAPRRLPPPSQKPKSQKIALMGRKTPAMHDQLGAFHKYLKGCGYKGDESRLYSWAERCWNAKCNKDRWNLARFAGGTARGYSCSKAMADAYKHLSKEQKESL